MSRYSDDEWHELVQEFAEPGGTSALRRATRHNPRNLPCPTCGAANRLTPRDRALGDQCNACADRTERGYEGDTMTLIDTIRQQYPHPRSGSFGVNGDKPYLDGEYCVGGALCAFYNLQRELSLVDLFPSRFELADALLRANTRLVSGRALRLAEQIIRANDANRFDDAWACLDLALDDGKE